MTNQPILKVYLSGWQDAVHLLKRPIQLVPLITFTLIRLAPLLSVTFFSHPPFAEIAVPAMRGIFGEDSLRYPQHLEMLPHMYRFVDMSAWLVFGSTLVGWSVFMTSDALRSRRVAFSQYAVQVLWSIPSFLLMGVLFAIVVFGIPYLYDWISTIVHHERLLQLLLVSSVSLWLLVMSFLVYSFSFLRHGTVNPIKAVGKSIGFVLSQFSLTIMIVVTGLAIYVPGYLLMSSLATPHVSSSDPLFPALFLKVLFETLALYYFVVATTSVVVGRRTGRLRSDV